MVDQLVDERWFWSKFLYKSPAGGWTPRSTAYPVNLDTQNVNMWDKSDTK